jgi:tetratricopeptide (TPR) repeat protein
MVPWVVVFAGCFLGSSREGARALAAKGEAELLAGNLPAAAATYEQGVAGFPEDVELATGAAFLALLQNDAARADRLLGAVEPSAGDRTSEVALRRALVALHAGDLDGVKAHAARSELPMARLLSAEVSLAEGEREAAEQRLRPLTQSGLGAAVPSALAETAKDYLELLRDPDPLVAGLSEVQALWALGKREVAIRSAEELLKALPDDDTRDTQLLLWAGRAAAVREVEVARSLLDAMIVTPPEQQWRKLATQAMAVCAEGRAAECLAEFEVLGALPRVPVDGLADARATAAMLVAKDDRQVATALAGPYLTDASARALHAAGADQAAWEASRSDLFAEFLRPGG